MLFERDRSCLVVIDVQQYFLDKLPAGLATPLVERIAWFMRVAHALGIPIIATAEDIPDNGSLVSPLANLLPQGTPIFNKMVFGLYDQADIRAAVTESGRTQFVLVGLETDVCVAHSAIGLVATGHHVAVIEDACGSPPPHHEAGLQRIRDAGILVTTLKGMHYEWVRDLATLKQFKAAIGSDRPAGLTL